MRASALGVIFGLGLGACSAVETDAPLAETASPEGQPAMQAFDDASATWGVPSDLLKALALAETGMRMVVGHDEHGRDAAYGVMALRGARVFEAADRLGVDPERVRSDRATNIAGAAALLSDWAEEAGIDREDLRAWAPVVARFGDVGHDEAAAEYVWDEVYGRLQDGVTVEGGGIKAYGADLRPLFPEPAVRASIAGIRPGTVWRNSPNNDARNSGAGGVGMVVIHTCEGTYSGCWGWLSNANSGVSAHYVVNDSGSEVSQLVYDDRRAWHVGATYDCSLNGSTDCGRNGWSVNHFSVGIEHAGYANQGSWSSGLLQRSAELTCALTQDYGIPRDNYHIVAHGTLQPYNRYDPGPNWPWADYINRVRAACGDTTPNPGGGGGGPGSFVIESNNGANDTSRYELSISGNWTSSQNVAGYYNTGYYVAPTAAVSDPANFRFLATGPVCYEVEAWWTSAADRATNATFVAFDASGTEVGRASVNQSTLGARWNRLGTWAFSSGWNRVALSRWTTAGYYVIADAVRLTPSTACSGCQFSDPDGDGTNDCTDACPQDPAKTAAGACGCGVAESDADGDGAPDCTDGCDLDPLKTTPGTCGCGSPDTDGDGDGALDCVEVCDADPDKTDPGVCGCGVPDLDITGDGVPDCTICGDGVVQAPEGCDDGNTVAGDGCSDVCAPEAIELRVTPGTAGVRNTFAVRYATPGAAVTLIRATRPGVTQVPGCPGLTVPVASPVVLASPVAGANGVARYDVVVPAAMAGQSARIVAVELSTCRASALWLETF